MAQVEFSLVAPCLNRVTNHPDCLSSKVQREPKVGSLSGVLSASNVMLKKAHKNLLWAALLAILAGASYLLFVPRNKEVEVLTAAIAPAERVLAVNGRIRPRLQVDIRPSLGGELVSLPYDVGDQIAQGTILAKIDDAPEIAAIAEANAAVQAQQAVLEQARRDLARFEALGEFVSRADLEQRRLTVEEGARELNRREANVRQAKELRDRRVLRAPFSGVILDRPMDPGQTVSPDSVIYRLADLSSPEVSAEVDEIYATEIRPGMAALVSLPGLQEPVSGEVVHIEPLVDPATGARDVRIAINNAGNGVPAGLTVTVNLVIEALDQAISIPRRLILYANGRQVVRVVDSDGIVSEQTISFVNWPAEQVIVVDGLEVGDRILLDPEAALPGQSVRIAD